MVTEDLKSTMAQFAQEMRREALSGVFWGREDLRARLYLQRCTRRHPATQANLMFTRDAGHHSSGWMKNPDYERCWHLSLSPMGSGLIVPAHLVRTELDRATTAAWLEVFFNDDRRYVWAEPPFSQKGREAGVWHWRLFCDNKWRPILPRGEVYSTELTEMGWRSASQVLEEDGVRIESTADPS